MNKKGLCKKIIKIDTKFDGKICADVFEAILGVIYYWGFYIKGLKYCVLDDIKHWLVDNWHIQETIINLLEYGEPFVILIIILSIQFSSPLIFISHLT